MGATVSTVSSSLQFDRAGTHLLIADPDAVSVVDVAGGTLRIGGDRIAAVAGFDDQIWIVGGGNVLVRSDHAGRPIGEPVVLPAALAAARLVPAPHGPAGAVWLASPALGLIDDLGQLGHHPLPDGDVVIPLTARRALIATGARIQLPGGYEIRFTPGHRVLGGAALADGKLAALVIGHGGRRQIATLALGTAQLGVRCEVATGAIRIAARRGVAVIHAEPRRFDVVDLRAGRTIGSFAVDHAVADHAIDPDGRRLALRDGDGAGVEIVHLADQLGPARRSTAADSGPEPEPLEIGSDPVSPPTPPRPAAVRTAPVPAPDRAPPRVDRPLLALEPRTDATTAPPLARADALARLDRELRGVALWALCAIADGWDTRRLGYGNEGVHPFELEVAAILGMNRGFATEHLAAAREHLADHDRAIAADPSWRASETPVGALAAELGLDDRATDIVMVVAAAALWGEVARLYGILANDPGRPVVDEQMVHQVLGARHPRHDLAAELDPRAPLVRLGVIQIGRDRPRPFAELTVDPVVLDRLRATTPDLGRAVALRGADRALADLAVPRDVIDAALAALAQPPHGPARIAVRGRAGAGRRTALATLARAAGRDLAVIDAQALPRQPDDFVAALGASLRRVMLVGAIPCVVGLDRIAFADRTGAEVATEVVAAHPGPIAIIAPPDVPLPLAAGHVEIALPPLPETDRLAVWTGALAAAGLAVADPPGLAARYRIGPGVIHRAVDAVRDRGAGSDDAGAALEAFIRQSRDVGLGQHARRVEHLASWSSVVLPPDVLDSLRELIGRVRHGRTVFDTWGMGRALTTSRGLTALFSGQPGTGKTLVAGVIARELGLDLYQVDLSKVMSKWIGETERNLAAIFDAAEDGQVVLLFDEADSLFAKRTEVRSSNDRYANLEVNYLLQRLDAFAGIAILTTNFSGSIDPALKRRMSFRLSFPFPDEETREQLWRAHLPPELPVAGALALDALARKYQLSGGYIRNACLRAAFLAAQEETALHQHHLERAVALEFAELGKLSTSGAIS